VWDQDDPALKVATYGEQARAAAGVPELAVIPGKHFPHEDQAAAMVDHVARIASPASPADGRT